MAGRPCASPGVDGFALTLPPAPRRLREAPHVPDVSVPARPCVSRCRSAVVMEGSRIGEER